MKHFWVLFFVVFLVSCKKGENIGAQFGEVILLTNVTISTGYNSEATAIVNVMRYLGYDVDEVLISGAGAISDFAFYESAFPFINIKNINFADVCFKNMNIKWSGKIYTGNTKSWKLIKSKLKEGIPVVLRVNMRFLPHRFGGKYGSNFSNYGLHYVALFGIDEKKGVAFISDNNYSNLIEIKLKDLDKARYSSTQAFPPYGEFYWIEKKEEKFSIDYRDLFTNSINSLLKNYERPKKQTLSKLKVYYGLEALKNLSKELADIESLVRYEMFLSPALNALYFYIDKLETYGSANRQILKEYLIKINKKLKKENIARMIKQLDNCIKNWKMLSSELYKISEEIDKYKEKYERKALYERTAAIANQLYEEERIFYEMLTNFHF